MFIGHFVTKFTPTFTIEGSSYYYGTPSTLCTSRLHSYNRIDFVSGHVVFNRFVQWSCQVPLISGGQHKMQLYSLRHHEYNKLWDTNQYCIFPPPKNVKLITYNPVSRSRCCFIRVRNLVSTYEKNVACGCSRTRIQGTIFRPKTQIEQGNDENSVTRYLVIFEKRDDFQNSGSLAIQPPDAATNPRESSYSSVYTRITAGFLTLGYAADGGTSMSQLTQGRQRGTLSCTNNNVQDLTKTSGNIRNSILVNEGRYCYAADWF